MTPVAAGETKVHECDIALDLGNIRYAVPAMRKKRGKARDPEHIF